MDHESLYPEYRASFIDQLIGAGFNYASSDKEFEAWSGTLTVNWTDEKNQESYSTDHAILIHLRDNFPFTKPVVIPLDNSPAIRDALHQEPNSDNGALCLYGENDDGGWLPWTTVSEFLERVNTWFVHFHQRDWPADLRPPDLHLYFKRDPDKKIVLIGDPWLSIQNQLSGRFGIWDSVNRVIFAGAPLGESVDVPHVTNDRILPLLGLHNSKRSVDGVGLWFRLKRAPVPHSQLDEILREIDQATEQNDGWTLKHILRLAGYKIVGKPYTLTFALGYQDDAQNQHWLFLWAKLNVADAKCKKWRDCLEKVAVGAYEMAWVDRESLMRRIGPEAKVVDGKKILIFGQGAIGSSISLLLAKSGVQYLHIVDSDRLRPGNSVRHIAGLTRIGMAKTKAVQFEVKSHAPDCIVETSAATWDINQLRSWIWEADVVIDATANIAFSLLLNELCIRERSDLINVATYRNAKIGRVQLIRPGIDACIVCRECSQDYKDTYLTVPVGHETSFIESGCGIPTVEASAIDIEATAILASKTVIRVIRGDRILYNDSLLIQEAIPEGDSVFRRIGSHDSFFPSLRDGCDVCAHVRFDDEVAS